MSRSFTFRRARSTALVVAIGAVLVIETTALHLLLVPRHPAIAWSLTLVSLYALGWLIVDHRLWGRSAVTLDSTTLGMEVGLRCTAMIPRDRIISAISPTWRDLPASGDRGWLNAMKPATPNVLLTLSEATPVRLLGLVNRPVVRLGLCVDDPAALLDELHRPSA